MYIDKTYPFEVNRFLHFNTLDTCLGTLNLLNHYNNIYCTHVNNLNSLLSKYPSLQNYSLDELIYNHELFNIEEKNELYKLTNAVYSHHVFFSSITPCKTIIESLPLYSAINKCFGSLDNFYASFKNASLNIVGSGYVYLTCDKDLNLSIIQKNDYDTPIKDNLYPLLAIDLWEHSYLFKFNTDRTTYVNNFLNVINWDYANNEYLECKNCV